MSAPDDLYQMGQDAGMEGFDKYPTQAPEVPEAPIGASSGGELGRPDVMSGGLTPPEALPPHVVPPASGYSHSTSSSGSYSGSGGLSAQDRKDPELNSDLAKANAMAQGQAAPMLAAEGKANTEGVDATKKVTEAAVNKMTAEGHAATLMGHIQNDFAAEEANINAHATAVSNQAKADYMAALMDFKASNVDPSQLWNSRTGGQQFGMLVTAFVHDFLGARGIHTTAMDTFNKAIERNIDAQVNAIKTKGEVANGFKNLWEMQRQQSASDIEARARVRGFLLEGAKSAITAHMAQYDAGLATAQGQAAIAKMDAELAKSYVEIYKHIDQNTVALRQQALAKWEAKMKNAQESWHNSIAERDVKVKENAAKPSAYAGLVGDPTRSGGGFARWELNNPKDETAARNVATQMGALAAFDKKMDRFIELGRQVDAIPTKVGKEMFLSQNQRELVALQSDLAMHGALAVHGSRFSDTLIKRMEDQFPIDTWTTSDGGVEKILWNKKAMVHNDASGAIAGFAHELAPDDPRRKLQVAPSYDSVPGQSEFKEAQAGANPVTSREEAYRKELESKLSGPQGMEKLDPQDVGADVAADHEKFLKAYPQFKSEGDKIKESPFVVPNGPLARQQAATIWNEGGTGPREFERSLTRLKENVEKDPGDAESIAAIYAQARPFLNHTSGAFGMNPEMEAQSAYATLMLLDLNLGTNPDSGPKK